MNSTSTPEPTPERAVAATTARLFSTRTLLVCAALAVVAGVIAQLSRVLGVAIQAIVPWLSFPAPLPWFLGIMVAVALFRRPGVALITGFLGMVASAGGLVLVGGIIIELVFLTGRYRRWSPARYYLAAGLIAVVNFGFMYLYADFTTLPILVQILAFLIRLGLYLGYAWLALWTTAQLERAGIHGVSKARSAS
ncbi:ECF transporter S component [Microbacterium esteraromaticum]|uniref:ECF transporter S component n=1 Tax=Microbacterium esteraromaticum TaxID=57043 RepID=UPI000B35AAAD|nr:ECF transporter S component [Microbacterium esteraromaticum]